MVDVRSWEIDKPVLKSTNAPMPILQCACCLVPGRCWCGPQPLPGILLHCEFQLCAFPMESFKGEEIFVTISIMDVSASNREFGVFGDMGVIQLSTASL